jgi:hypothetical protein
MSDITAVVLTTGEETTQRAVDSVKKQTLPPEEIIIIKNITPFHKALNLGASRVKTEFFVQVDSDMILDENCLEALRKCMMKDVGIAVGHLRDPLIGRVSSIKMFRKKCFEKVQFKDSISSDTDFAKDISQCGWKTVFALRFIDKTDKKLWHTFGEHRPNYTPHYTYSKHLLEGRRWRYRKDLGGLFWHLAKLKNSNCSVSLIAQIAISHGIFMEEENDLLNPYSKNEDFDFLERFLTKTGTYNINRLEILPFFIFNPKKAFKKYYKLGINLKRVDAFPAFKYCMGILNKSRDDFSWIAKVGLCHGLFLEDYSEEKFEKEYHKLNEFLSGYNLHFILKKKLKCFLISISYFFSSF